MTAALGGWLWLAVPAALVVGGTLGALAMAACAAGGRADDALEQANAYENAYERAWLAARANADARVEAMIGAHVWWPAGSVPDPATPEPESAPHAEAESVA